MKHFPNWFKNHKTKGEIGIISVIIIAILAIVAVVFVPIINTVGVDGAVSRVRIAGYTVIASADYDELNAKLDALKVTTDQTVHAEEHIHHEVIWFGISGDQSGNDWADRVSMNPFVATSGNNTWGGATATDYAKILGTDDTPLFTGGEEYDAHQVLIESNSSATVYRCRFIWGTGTVASAISAGQFSEFVYMKPVADKSRKIIDVTIPRVDTDVQLWLNIWNATNDATIDVFVGVHEYEYD